MSSSKAPTTGLSFLVTIVATGLTLSMALLAAIWIYDPTGVLRAHKLNPDICPTGLKHSFYGHRSAMAAHFRFSEPEILLVGSSRTIFGIAKSSLSADGTPVLNMSLSGISADELFNIVEAAIERETTKEIWIALDYGLFVMPPKPSRMRLEIPDNPTSDWDYLQAGLFSTDLIAELLPNLSFPPRVQSCNLIARDIDGFSSEFNLRGMEAIRRNGIVAEQIEWQTLGMRSWGAGQHQADRLQRLNALLIKSAEKDKDIRIFVPPSPPGYFESVAKARGAVALNSWRGELTQIAGRHGNVQFHDFSDMFSERTRLPEACKLVPVDDACPFYDLTHFTPELGDKLVAKFK
jgi:hypothetical protein